MKQYSDTDALRKALGINGKNDEILYTEVAGNDLIVWTRTVFSEIHDDGKVHERRFDHIFVLDAQELYEVSVCGFERLDGIDVYEPDRDVARKISDKISEAALSGYRKM